MLKGWRQPHESVSAAHHLFTASPRPKLSGYSPLPTLTSMMSRDRPSIPLELILMLAAATLCGFDGTMRMFDQGLQNDICSCDHAIGQ